MEKPRLRRARAASRPGSFKIAEGKPPVMAAQHGFSNPAELPPLIRQVSCRSRASTFISARSLV